MLLNMRARANHDLTRPCFGFSKSARLTQFLSFDPPEYKYLHENAKRGDDDEGQKPVSCQSCEFVADISAQKVKRAMRQMDISHEPKNQREAIEKRIEKDLFGASGILQPIWPDGEKPPQQNGDRRGHERCPDWMTMRKNRYNTNGPRC